MQNFRALGAPLPDPQPPAAGGIAPRLPKQPPHCEFLATRLLSHTAEQKFSNVFLKGYSPILKYRSRCSYTKFLNKIFINK